MNHCIIGAGADGAERLAVERNEKVMFKIYGAFTDCIGEINNSKVDNAKDFDLVMPM